MYRHAPGTIWRHALARVERRARTLARLEAVMFRTGSSRDVAAATIALWNLREAARLANRLAYCAGVA